MSTTQPLVDAVRALAQATHHFSESLLGSQIWAWREYVEVRYLFLGAYLELRDLAGELLATRVASGQPPSPAQHLLAQHHAAFREVEALLIGLPPELVHRAPASGEWSVNIIVTHIHSVERYFYATILNALRNPAPLRLDAQGVAATVGDTFEPDDQQPLAQLWANYERLHWRILAELSQLGEGELATIAPMWESAPIPIRFRLHRFDAHLREHANQLEKTIRLLGHAPNEARMLLRQLYAALAEVEGALLGAPESGQDACAALATTLTERTGEVLERVEQARAMIGAVASGDLSTIERLLAVNRRLATARSDEGLSVLLQAIYNGQSGVVQTLAAARDELSFFEAAAIGNGEEIEAWLRYDPRLLNSFAC
ncbi:MAG TPA: DinB family protein, partial [Caldilineaceae bacterium]|nr:DinB family protein [Caldilineaceae bacterium]